MTRLKWKSLLSWFCLGLPVLLGLLNLIPFSQSEEWLYTLKLLNLTGGVLVGILVLAAIWSPFRIACLICAYGCVLAACLAPGAQSLGWQWQYVLSLCWAVAFILGALALFSLGSARAGLRSWFFCGLASLCFAIASLELFFLFTPQGADGIVNASATSKFASPAGKPETSSWGRFQCGTLMSPGYGKTQVYHRVTRFGDELFDALYSFNESGFRITPKGADNAENNLMLFGCSMTFGHGLNDEQTWASQLANILGPEWQVENYAMSSWSANQTLCMLEHELIPIPVQKKRYALFLAIEDHLRRNDFFGSTPHYVLDESGVPRQAGKHRFASIHNMPDTFNGSQLAREASNWLRRIIMSHPEPMLELYLAMLKRTAQLLEQKYQTKFYVLLWPDFESVRQRIEELGIPVIMARDLLPDWEKGANPGSLYHISPGADGHPNARAAREMAIGLAEYFKRLTD